MFHINTAIDQSLDTKLWQCSMSMFGSLLLRLIVAQLNLTVQAPYYNWTYASQQKLLFSLKAYKKKSLKKNAYVKKKKKENKTPQQTNQKNPTTKTFFSIAISGQKESGSWQARRVLSSALAFNYFPTIATACLVTT